MNKVRGFTLLELMIVVLIIAIISAIAYPMFTSQLRKSRRSEARQALSDLALKQEKYRSFNASYATCDQAYAPSTCATMNGTLTYYTVTVTLDNATKGTKVVLTAAGKYPQTKDTSCTSMTYTIDKTTVTKAPTGCW